MLGVPNSAAGTFKATNNIVAANQYGYPDKKSRELLNLQYQNMIKVLNEFATGANFNDSANTFKDAFGNYLFPTTDAKNGNGSGATGYVVDRGAYSFFTNLKAAALILNETDAVVAGTELGGFDTHNNQITNAGSGATFTFNPLTGGHADLQKRIGWAIYALREFFLQNHDRATWENMVVVTLSEFGRTTVQNGTIGTDHAEGGAMFVAGGSVKGYGKKAPGSTGVYGCHTDDAYNSVPKSAIGWAIGSSTPGVTTGSMFGVSSRYLKRAVDYRSVLGELIRDHLGATQAQLNRIIPAYTVTGQKLQTGGATTNSTTDKTDGTTIAGELDIV